MVKKEKPIEGEVVQDSIDFEEDFEESQSNGFTNKKSKIQELEEKGVFKAFGILLVLLVLGFILSSDEPAPSDANGQAGKISLTLPIKTVPEIKKDILTTLGISELGKKLEQTTQQKETQTITNQRVVNEESAVIETVKNVSPSVVSIVVKRNEFDLFSGPSLSEESIGTGFVVDKTGLVVTNAHVVNLQDATYSIVFKDGTTYDVTRVSLDESTDLAVLEVQGKNLPVVELGDSDKIKVGQTAVAIGNALGQFSHSVTLGVVSGLARELTASGAFGESKIYEDVIQTDAALNPGNSGGPLLNLAGQVIGINVATTRGADNVGFAIPVNVLKPILEGYLKEGKIVRPFLGVSYTMITEDLAKLRDFPQGAYISSVMPTSPAGEAGIQRGDIIVEFEGQKLNTDTTLGALIRTKKPGDKVSLVIDREGEQISIEVELTDFPTEDNTL